MNKKINLSENQKDLILKMRAGWKWKPSNAKAPRVKHMEKIGIVIWNERFDELILTSLGKSIEL